MTIDDIALTLERGLGVKGAARLLEVFGSAEAVYAARPEELVRRGELRESLAAQIARKEAHTAAGREMTYAERHEITPVASTDDDFPPLLREIPDFPHVLYVRGEVGALRLNCVSIVGTRQISTYGQTMCDRLVRQLSERIPDLCIVSGLAFGIDVHCHRAALRYGVPTVAVVANALPEVTPGQHAAIAREIVEKGGAIVSELHSNAKQAGDYYIPRNRIIAGLAEGTVVVEAAHGSGALTTADMALGYNRILMAVPGRATDTPAWGPNSLIKSQKAIMVCTGEDIVRALDWDIRGIATDASCAADGADAAGSSGTAGGGISADAAGLLKCFVGGNATSVDSLTEVTALVYGQLAPLLLELEFAGKIRRLPGGSYEKIN